VGARRRGGHADLGPGQRPARHVRRGGGDRGGVRGAGVPGGRPAVADIPDLVAVRRLTRRGRGRVPRPGAPHPGPDPRGWRLLRAAAQARVRARPGLRAARPDAGDRIEHPDAVRRGHHQRAGGREQDHGGAAPRRARAWPVGVASRPARLLGPRCGPGDPGAGRRDGVRAGGRRVRQLHVPGDRRPRDRRRASVQRGAGGQAARRPAHQGEAGTGARRRARLLSRRARLQRHPADRDPGAPGPRGLAGRSPPGVRPGRLLGVEHRDAGQRRPGPGGVADRRRHHGPAVRVRLLLVQPGRLASELRRLGELSAGGCPCHQAVRGAGQVRPARTDVSLPRVHDRGLRLQPADQGHHAVARRLHSVGFVTGLTSRWRCTSSPCTRAAPRARPRARCRTA
jgi:hypothetical protein